MYKKFLNKIKEYDQIVIFKHIHPDGDCMYSNLALYYFLKDNFKDKKIRLGGYEDYDLVSKRHNVSDKFISESLCIILDVSTTERIDDKRALNGKYKIKIDHHPFGDEYADLSYVDISASAACEVLANILFSNTFKDYVISKTVCKYLYSGIVTDTLNFRTTNVNEKTLEIASKIAKHGNLDIANIVEFNMNKSLVEFNKRTKFRTYLKIHDNFGYIKLDKNDLEEINVNCQECKTYIEEIGCIKELYVWCVAAMNDNGLYELSLRSRRGYIINKVAMKYGGGGHANASGVKDLNEKQLKNIFDDLYQVSQSKNKK